MHVQKKPTSKVVIHSTTNEPLIVLYTSCILDGSHLVSHDDTHRVLFRHVSLLFPFSALSAARLPAGIPSRWREQAASEQGKALHTSAFAFHSQFASGMNSLLKYLPLLDVTELQKRGSISIQKEGQVTRFIEASLAAAPKDKERSECI